MALYVPLVNDDRTAIYMLKSTVASPADTDWDNQDGAVFVLPTAGLIETMWAVEDGSDIHINRSARYPAKAGRLILLVPIQSPGPGSPFMMYCLAASTSRALVPSSASFHPGSVVRSAIRSLP